MDNKKIYLIVGVGFLLLALSYFFIYLDYYQKEREESLTKSEEISITISIDYGNGKTETLEKTFSNANRTEPYTAFEALNGLFDIEATEQKWGTSIKCINDICGNESTGYYWFFWHNGDFSSVSTEKYYLKDNDIVAMKYMYSGDVGM